MKHVAMISQQRRIEKSEVRNTTSPFVADAKSDFMNAMWRAWSNFLYEKKNEVSSY